jgi:hypothetical protein
MPRIHQAPLRERKAHELVREREISRVFRERDKPLESLKREKKQKKKSISELYALLDLDGIAGAEVRDAYSYIARSHNLERQLRGLLNHLFASFPVPAFLYSACIKSSRDPFARHHDVYRQWFLALAQGRSFSKLVKGMMTSREAFIFLSAPASNLIHVNVWWAKMKATGLPEKTIVRLIDGLFANRYCRDDDGRMADVIRFYARYHEQMSRVTFGEITDFLAWKLQNDTEFTLKGRTVASVVRLANEWHALIQKARLGHHVEWAGMEIPDWEFVAKDRIWRMIELRTNKDLMAEGHKQKHCVYSYVHWCSSGRSSIFSLRSYRKIASGYTPEGDIVWDHSMELDQRVTIEVNRQQSAVVQVRGLLNRMPTDEERGVIRHWSGEKGLLFRTIR